MKNTNYTLRIQFSQNNVGNHAVLSNLFNTVEVMNNYNPTAVYWFKVTTNVEELLRSVNGSHFSSIPQHEMAYHVLQQLVFKMPDIDFTVLENYTETTVFVNNLFAAEIPDYLIRSGSAATGGVISLVRPAGHIQLLGYLNHSVLPRPTGAGYEREQTAHYQTRVEPAKLDLLAGLQCAQALDREKRGIPTRTQESLDRTRVVMPIDAQSVKRLVQESSEKTQAHFEKEFSKVSKRLGEIEANLPKPPIESPAEVQTKDDRFQKGIRILACFERHIAPEEYIEHLNDHFELGETVPGFDPRAVLHNRTSFFIKDSKVYATSHFDRIRTWSDTQKLFDPCMFVSGFIEAAVVVQDNYFDRDYTVIVYPGSNAEQAAELKRQFKDTLIHNIENSFT